MTTIPYGVFKIKSLKNKKERSKTSLSYEEFVDSFGNDSFASFKERYMGQWDSEKDFAEHIVDECYNLDDMMGHLASYFDYEAYARDLFIDDFYFTDGYVFRR